MTKFLTIVLCLFTPLIYACENTDVLTMMDAGVDTIKAATLSDEEIKEIASRAADMSDKRNNLADADNKYALRLKRLVGDYFDDGGIRFNYRVYLSPEINAFAMADGSIRIYSGLMDMMNDSELRFVVGHEMGHVIKNHVRKKIQMAFAASAVRKGIASQNNAAGDVARSPFGGLAEKLMNAQFSQLEEKEADDYGLVFLKQQNIDSKEAVSALRKLAKLGNEHSFLSSHPDPDKRAERLHAQLEGRAISIGENKKDIVNKVRLFIEDEFRELYKRFTNFIS